jgi:hypothetical protein
MHGTTTKITYQIRFMPTNENTYPLFVRNQRIPTILVENFPLHNLVYIEPIVTTQENYSHGNRSIPTKFVLKRFIVKEPFVNVLVLLTIGIPSHNIITTILVPLDLRGNLPRPIGSVVVTFVQPIAHYYKRPFNYLE